MKENKYKLNEFVRNQIIDFAEQEISAELEKTVRNKRIIKEGIKFTMYIAEDLVKEMFDNYK